jgi:hypothetical protein
VSVVVVRVERAINGPFSPAHAGHRWTLQSPGLTR